MKNWYQIPTKKINQTTQQQAHDHQQQLTKPAGSLGQLEKLAEQFAGFQGCVKPQINKVKVAVFAGDHGVCQQGVSAFPQAVTMQMILNFLQGGAAISVLSRQLQADFCVVNTGIATPLPEAFTEHAQLIHQPIAEGTADFSQQAAMTEEQLEKALALGASIVAEQDIDLFIGGEMGIGNTTAASAIYAALLSLSPEQVAGRGTGVDDEGLTRKQMVIANALNLHQCKAKSPLDVLRCVGGFEIAALTGAYIACAQQGTPVLVDGFICTAAALLAVRTNPGVREWLLFSHRSAEPAHHFALETLQAQPLLDLGLRLGEGSGAAVATTLIQSALLLHNEMATFAEAGVSDSEG